MTIQYIRTADDLPIRAPKEGVVLMAWPVWSGLQDHPRQRDTERHAKAKHFIEAKKSNRGVVRAHLGNVTAAIYKDRWYKVDGHTRTYLWRTGSLRLPEDETLKVTVYDCGSREELNKLYMMFDNPSAAERSYQQVFGAMRELDLSLNSKRLRRGHFKDALYLAVRGLPSGRQPANAADLDLYKATGLYRNELQALDTMSERGLRPEVFFTGILAAALVTVKIWPETLEMWRALNDDDWERTAGKFDAAGIIAQHLRSAKGDERKTRNANWQEHLFRMALMTAKKWHEAHLKGEQHWFRTVPRELDPLPLIEQVREKTAAAPDPTLFLSPEEMQRQGGPAPLRKA